MYWQNVQGVNRTWDGGGVDGTCGGAGTANNWSCAANWSSDTAPTASDVAIFDGTSTKNATINANISVAGISINAGYTGTITQSGSNTITIGSSNYSQADGTFTGGAGNVTINTNSGFTLSGGTFTAPSGVFQIGYGASGVSAATVFTVSGGTFNHNNGTMKFVSGSDNSHSYTIDVPTSLTFYNLEWDTGYNQPCFLTPGSGDTIIVANNITITDGRLSGSWEVQGNVIIGSGADSGGIGTLTMNGTGSKTYTHSAGGVGPHLIINNAGLSVSANGGTTSLSVTFFTLLAGTFSAPTGIFQVGRAGISNPSETVFTVSGGTFNHNNGTMKFVSGSDSPGVFTIDVPTSLTLYGVEWDMGYTSACTLTTAVGDTIIVANNFTHTDGALAGIWQVQGNYTVASTADGGTAGITFTGGNSQAYTDQGGGRSRW